MQKRASHTRMNWQLKSPSISNWLRWHWALYQSDELGWETQKGCQLMKRRKRRRRLKDIPGWFVTGGEKRVLNSYTLQRPQPQYASQFRAQCSLFLGRIMAFFVSTSLSTWKRLSLSRCRLWWGLKRILFDKEMFVGTSSVVMCTWTGIDPNARGSMGLIYYCGND